MIGLKLNFNSIGLYRVKYELQTLTRLNEPVAKKIISPRRSSDDTK